MVDRIGAKPILLLGMILQGFGGVIVAGSWTVVTLIFGLTCISVASSFYHNSGLSTISRSLMPNNLSKAMGLHNAIADRVLSLAFKARLERAVTLTGGVAKNPGVVHAISSKLDHIGVNVPKESQLAGAIGAALIARDCLKK